MRRRALGRARRPRRGVGVLVVVAATALVAGVGGLLTRSAAAPPPPSVSVSLSQTDALVDGQRIFATIRVGADVALNSVTLKQCKDGQTFADRTDLLYLRGKCPLAGVSSSSDVQSLVSLSGALAKAKTPAGLEIPFRVGTGTTDWPINSTTRGTITCDTATPCALVVQYVIGAEYFFTSIRLTFAESDPLKACGGADPAILQSAGSDELIDTWGRWTRAFCGLPGSAGAASVGSFGGGEGPAVSGFSSGLNDLAYTAAGYDPTIALQGPGVGQRNAVPVPVALNAAVMATGSGRVDFVDGQPAGKSKIDRLRLRAEDAAALTAGGIPLVANSPVYGSSIRSLNPNLGDDLYYGAAPSVYASSSFLASTWFWTKYLSVFAPDDFVVPNSSPPQRRPASTSFATAEPNYASQLFLFTGRPAFARTADRARLDQDGGGPIWTITDRASAKALDLGDVAVPAASGDFVAATDESMRAAVPTMKRNAAGMLLPDIVGPSRAGIAAVPTPVTSDVVTPYPLTYVVYAMAPAEPLYSETCQPRPASQALLTRWLTYITTTGQGDLAPGLVALPEPLRAEAAAQIAKVGTAPLTGPCAVTPPAPAPPSPSVAPVAPVTPSRTPVPPTVAAPAPAAAPTAAPVAAAELVSIPMFSRRVGVDPMGGVVALAGIALITSLGVFLTARGFAPGPTGGEGGFVDLGSRRSVLGLVGLWLAVGVVGVGLVAYQLGPLLQQRQQRALLTQYASELTAAAFADQGLPLARESADRPPEPGAPVGLVSINAIASQSVVVEGVGPQQTDAAPGHVPGSAGLGQPGNSVVVGRRNGFGAPFRALDRLRRGDLIVTTTTQGRSVYEVESVGSRVLGPRLFAPSDDDRLTLITSASASPLNRDRAMVVTAVMRDLPFAPTSQGALTRAATRIEAGGGSLAPLAIALATYVAVIVGSVVLYRRFRFPVAYVLSIAPIVAATVILGEQVMRLLPSWT